MTDYNSNRIPVDRKLLARIFSKIKVSTTNSHKGVPCWEWQAFLNLGGYGVFRYKNLTPLAHRIIYNIFVGDIPDELHCDHLCRNRCCVNPAHIEPVTPKENNLRSPANQSTINARKTACVKGHLLAGDNLGFIKKPKQRYCKKCLRDRVRKSRHTVEQKQSRNEKERQRLQDPIALAKKREASRRYEEKNRIEINKRRRERHAVHKATATAGVK